MRSEEGGGGAGDAAGWSWSDPRVWEANACGEVTPAQRAVLVGPRVRPPVLAWVLLAVLVIVEGGAGVLGAKPKVGLLVEGGPAGAVATMVFMMVVLGWQLLLAALVAGVPKWGDRRARRRMIAELAACRVGSAVGEVVGARHARVGADMIPLAAAAPPLPPPGTYQLYWLELTTGERGPLLSVQPLDEEG